MGEPGLQTIQVKVHTFGLLRMRTEQARIDARVEAGTTVEGLLRGLAEEYDEGFLDVVIRQTEEPMVTLLLLNGRTLQLPHDLQRELQAGDQLHLIPPIAGG